jgi:acyl dehydratase
VSERILAQRYRDLALGMVERTRGRTISEADIVNFCALTGDWYWLHSNAEEAAKSPFGQRIAHGLLVYSYSAGLGIPPDARTLVANYGSDRLRFTKPVFIGDTISLEIEVLAKSDKAADGSSGIVDLRWDIFKQAGVLVCTGVLKVLMNDG